MPFNLQDYEPVEDRLRAFWSDWPHGRIVTELVKAEDGEFIVRAEVWRQFQISPPDPGPQATGYAQEREGSTVVNKTSALENCETSAIGRALANLGYAAKGKRPSREEMSKASAPAIGEGGHKRGEEPGEGSSSLTSPGSTCNHRGPSGNLLRLTSEGHCPRCGANVIAEMEGTTKDLGPA